MERPKFILHQALSPPLLMHPLATRLLLMILPVCPALRGIMVALILLQVMTTSDQSQEQGEESSPLVPVPHRLHVVRHVLNALTTHTGLDIPGLILEA